MIFRKIIYQAMKLLLDRHDLILTPRGAPSKSVSYDR